MTETQLAVLLTCFPGAKTAGAARRRLTKRLTSQGDTVLQTTVLRVDTKHGASVHDPQRAVRGMLTSSLTWGAFGLVAGTEKVESTLVWAVLGALCGGVYAYMAEHLLKKDQLARLGRRLPAPSSALLTFARTDDPLRLLTATAASSPATASSASISSRLDTSVYAGASMPVDLPSGSDEGATSRNEVTLLSMILVRYPSFGTARQVAAAATLSNPDRPVPQVELVVETRADGRRRVSDPAQGVGVMARSDVVSWGGFGLAFGAIVGLAGGGGILGFLEDGLATGIAWAVFGLVAGALYGLWAGRSISAHRLRGLGDLLPPGTSALLAWAEGAAAAHTVLDAPGAECLVLHFNPVPGGAVLEAVARP